MRIGAVVAALTVASTASVSRAHERLQVRLPDHAAAAMELRDVGSGVAIGVRLRGAAPVAPAVEPDGVRFHDVDGHATEWRCRPAEHGVEDFVTLVDPRLAAVTYELDVSRAAGVRLVGNVVELLDAGGVPRLRAATPWVVDARGRWAEGGWEVVGCAVDRSGRDPTSRPPVPPATDRCLLTVRFDPARLVYPVVVDPTWQRTASMAIARVNHTAVRIRIDGRTRVLVAGGSGAPIEQAFESVELYLPEEDVFSMTSPMAYRRESHVALALSEDEVLVAGGTGAPVASAAADAPLEATELYDAITGSWQPGPSLPEPVSGARGALAGGRAVIVAGDVTSNGVFSLSVATPTVWARISSLAEPRSQHAIVGLDDGRVAVIGGAGPTFEPIALVELIDAASGAQQSITGCIARRDPAAAVTASGTIVVAGGYGADQKPLASSEKLEPPYAGRGCAELPELLPARAGHTLTTVADTLVAVGGDPTSLGGVCGCLTDADVVRDNAWIELPPLAEGRSRHTATDLGDGHVLVLGGLSADQTARADGERLGVCRDERTASDENGAPVACFPYPCDGGVCRDTCGSVRDCVAPAVCSPEGACVDPESGPIEVGGCGCRLGDPRGRALAWLTALAAALALTRARSARRR